MTDLADLLVEHVRELAAVRFERDAYRTWFRAALDKLHEQHAEIERQRRQLALQRSELRDRAEAA